MNFHENMERHLFGMKRFFHEHFQNLHQLTQGMFCHDPHMHLHHLAKALPKEFLTELHSIYHQEREKFLSHHFQFAKEYRKLEHQMETLRLDVAEHCHIKESSFDKKVVSESLEALRKLRGTMLEMLSKERDRYIKFEVDTENKIYDKIHEFLNKK